LNKVTDRTRSHSPQNTQFISMFPFKEIDIARVNIYGIGSKTWLRNSSAVHA